MQKLILDAAFKLFIEEGFGNVSIRRLAESIEYSPATIYLYFKDKDEILHALHNIGFEELHKRFSEVEKIVNPIERVNRYGEVYLDFALENPEYYDLMFIKRGPMKKLDDLADGSPEEWTYGMKVHQMFQSSVGQCIEEGYLAGANVDIATFSLWASIHGIAALIIRKRCPMIDQDHLNGIARGARKMLADIIVANRNTEPHSD